MAKELELRRHTDNEGDVLTHHGVEEALEIGRHLQGGYQLVATSGAQRATQTAACFIAALAEEIPEGVIVEAGLRSAREDEWRAAYNTAGKGHLRSLRDADRRLVEEDSEVLANGLRRILERLDEGRRGLAIGHSPTLEAAVWSLTGSFVKPIGKGEGLAVVEDHGEHIARSLD